MSHLATIKTEIKDINAVKAMCELFGWTFNESTTEYQGMGWRGQCAHSITFPDERYELGLVKTDTGYRLEFDEYIQRDAWWQNKSKAAKKEYLNPIGEGGGKFLQNYGIQKAMIEAKRHGYTVRRENKTDGTVRLVMAGM